MVSIVLHFRSKFWNFYKRLNYNFDTFGFKCLLNVAYKPVRKPNRTGSEPINRKPNKLYTKNQKPDWIQLTSTKNVLSKKVYGTKTSLVNEPKIWPNPTNRFRFWLSSDSSLVIRLKKLISRLISLKWPFYSNFFFSHLNFYYIVTYYLF